MALWPVHTDPFEGNSCWLGNIGELIFSDISDYYSLTLDFSAELIIDLTTQNSVSFSETYFPDSSGMIRISNLKDFITPLFIPFLRSIPSFSTSLDLYVKVTYTYTLHREPNQDSNTGTEYGKVFFSQGTVKDYTPYHFPYLLTQVREKHSSPSRFEILAIPTRIWDGYTYTQYKHTLGIAYNLDGNPTWNSLTYFPESGTGYILKNMSARAVLDELGLTSVDELNALYAEVTLLDSDSNPIDRCRFYYDQCDSERDTTLLFRNYFGIPETLTCSGAATEDISLDATYAWLGDEYGKYDDDIILSNTVSTGFLTKETRALFKDLAHSPFVWLAEPLKHGSSDPDIKKIVITDLQASRLRVSKDIQSAQLTFRYAEKSYREPLLDIAEEITRARIFDGSFDNSFE